MKQNLLSYKKLIHPIFSMSRREFKNPFADYDGLAQIFDFNSNKLIPEIEDPLLKNAFALLQTLENHLVSERKSSDSSVYTGNPGIALLYMHFMKIRICSGRKDFLKDALNYVEPCIPHLRMEDFTFLCGDSGPLVIAAVLYQHKGLQKESLKLIRKIENMVQNACSGENPDELLYGRVGFLFSLLFLNKHLPGPHEARTKTIKEVIEAIFKSGQDLAKKLRVKFTPLFFKWYGEAYVGAAHGFAGILYLLLQAKEYLTEDQLNLLVRPAINFVLSLQFSSGNFPAVLEENTDKLVHWCHGAPGLAYMLLAAYETFNEEQYLEAAKACGEVVWNRGLLKKGYGICHGTAGNGYTHLRLFQVTKDVKYLWRAIKFAEWCYDYGKHGCHVPDRPFSLFEGLAGTIYYLIDLLEPLNAAFPGFQLF